MLQAEWKRAIVEVHKAVQKATDANREYWKSAIDQQEALIAVPLRSLAHHLKGYKEQQYTADRSKRCREKATIVGIYMTAFIALCTGGVLAGQWYEFYRGNVAVQRAFVTSYELRTEPDSPTSPTSWAISPILENAGNTSATQLRFRIARTYYSPIWAMQKFGPNVQPGVTDLDENEVEFTGLPSSAIALSPHAKISLATYVITEKTLGFLRANTLSSFLFGELEYFDVFGDWHHAKFCYRLKGRTVNSSDDDVGFMALGVSEDSGIEITRDQLGFRLCKRNNCTDEQCGNHQPKPNDERPALTETKRARLSGSVPSPSAPASQYAPF